MPEVTETTTTKKTALKNRVGVRDLGGGGERREHDRDGPRRSAHPSRARSRVVKSNSMVDAQTATGRITSVRSKASAGREHHRSQLVREHEQAEDDE